MAPILEGLDPEAKRQHLQVRLSQSQTVAAEDMAAFQALLRCPGVWMGQESLQAAAEVFRRQVELFSDTAADARPTMYTPCDSEGAAEAARQTPLRLLMSNGNHYEAIVRTVRGDVLCLRPLHCLLHSAESSLPARRQHMQ